MKTWKWIVCLLWCHSVSIYAQTLKPFLMTHIEYPYIEDYTDFFAEIYSELGFELTLFPTPSTRGLLLLNEGVADADAVRLSITAKNYPNTIVVQPKLKYAYLTLMCIQNKPCNRELLADENITIMLPEFAVSLLEADEFKARRANTDSYVNIPKMLKANRYNYGLFVLDDLMEAKFSADFQIVKIRRFSINHVIHKKHINLLPQLEEKIRTKLPELLARRKKRMTTK